MNNIMRLRFTLAIALIITVLLWATTPAAQAQNLVNQVIWPRESGEIWKSNQTGPDQGTAWRQINFDDSSWLDEPFKFYATHGTVPTGRGYYFRKEFEVTDVEQIAAIQAEFMYDDAGILFLNGQEVYRTIRNNLPTSPELSIFQSVPYGGAENYYVMIPAEENYCENGCTDTSTQPIPVDLLVEGTNVFGMMVWDRGGSDLGADLSLTFTRDLDVVLDNVAINEFVTSNGGGLLDEDFDSPDWIEFHNVSSFPVNLSGWLLRDLEAEWAFPNITLAVDEYLIVFASDKDRAVAGSELHTNFKLSKEGDALSLVNPDGFVISEYAVTDVPRQFKDVSWGLANNNASSIGYLNTATPGAANSGLGSNYAPVLRKFSDHIYNVGEPVSTMADGFDPDGAPVSYSMLPPPPGISIIASTGEITGTATQAGTFTTEIRVTDSDNMFDTESADWVVIPAPSGPTRLVMNEYNAVPPDRLLVAGEDPAFGPVLGNGGDWFEFVVVEDGLDLRGWTIQLWDRDRADDLLDVSAELVFNQRSELASLPAGTIITISETEPDDIRLNPPGDWHINLQSNVLDQGAFFTPESQENFNSSRSNQVVILRNANGGLESPAVGETDAWDAFVGGVSGGEVMSNCTTPSSVMVDPMTDYDDNGEFSSFGKANTCRVKNDPLDPDDDEFFVQDLGALRDGDGDGILDNVDLDHDNDGIANLTESSASVDNWTNASAGVSATGYKINYDGSNGGAWNKQINSVPLSSMGFTDNYRVSWRVGTTPSSNHSMLGLGISESSGSYSDIDFALYNAAGPLYIYESGAQIGNFGTVTIGTILAIEVSGGQLRYLVDGAVIRTQSLSGAPDFYIDTSFYSGAISYDSFTVRSLVGGADVDADNDGVDNLADLDSDNDTIADVVEAGLTDSNGDLIVDNLNVQGSVTVAPDSDGDGIPDYLDLESNNAANNGTAYDIDTTANAGLDTNNDGQLNALDTDGGIDENGNGVDDASEFLLGDVNCSGVVDVVDALFVMQGVVLLRTDTNSCPLANPTSEIYTRAGDVSGDGTVNVVDALFIMQCEVSLTNVFCP